MKKSLLLALLPMTALLGIAGCEDSYSAAVVYELRTDPIKMSALGIEPVLPDRPGQLPLLTVADLNHAHNPFYKENQEKNLVETEKFRDPRQVSQANRDEIKRTLDELFGTPANPKAGPMDAQNRELLKLADSDLAKGSKLYRVHCLHCHGVSGDGRGPTARWVNPHPRDYRQGMFKFQSVDAATDPKKMPRPNRRDLLRTLEVGIEGTAMPSFNLLPPEERELLVSYAIHLSLRGETEFQTFTQSYEYDKKSNSLKFIGESSVKDAVNGWYKYTVGRWVSSQALASLIKVGDMPFDLNDKEKFKASVMRGKKIFENPPAEYNLGNNACLTCHKDYGRHLTFREDIWGTFSKPNNLLQGVYRGGRHTVDVYYRIHSGIQPSGMINFGSVLAPDAIWDLVNFVQVLGNPTMRRAMDIFVD